MSSFKVKGRQKVKKHILNASEKSSIKAAVKLSNKRSSGRRKGINLHQWHFPGRLVKIPAMTTELQLTLIWTEDRLTELEQKNHVIL